MTQSEKTAESTITLPCGPDEPRKSYESPRLLDWGSILELTSGAGGFDVTDGDFSGSGGT